MTEKDTEIWGESLQEELPSDGGGGWGLGVLGSDSESDADEASAPRSATVPRLRWARRCLLAQVGLVSVTKEDGINRMYRRWVFMEALPKR